MRTCAQLGWTFRRKGILPRGSMIHRANSSTKFSQFLPFSFFRAIRPALVLVFFYPRAPAETGFARFQPMDSRFRRKSEEEAAEPATSNNLALVTSATWCQVLGIARMTSCLSISFFPLPRFWLNFFIPQTISRTVLEYSRVSSENTKIDLREIREDGQVLRWS